MMIDYADRRFLLERKNGFFKAYSTVLGIAILLIIVVQVLYVAGGAV